MANDLSTSTIQVQVCYALADKIYLQDVSIATASAIQDAILASDVLQQYPEIELATARVGIFGKLKALGNKVGLNATLVVNNVFVLSKYKVYVSDN